MSEEKVTILWEKPSGLKIETNDLPATVKYCESLYWEQVGKKKPKKDKDTE